MKKVFLVPVEMTIEGYVPVLAENEMEACEYVRCRCIEDSDVVDQTPDYDRNWDCPSGADAMTYDTNSFYDYECINYNYEDGEDD